MKATGIVRRIDDLGRIVVPKELRRTMNVRLGEHMEIYTNDSGEIILKKYSAISHIEKQAQQVADIIAKLVNCPVIVLDFDNVIAVAGTTKSDYLDLPTSKQFQEFLEKKKPYTLSKTTKQKIQPVDRLETCAVACVPVVIDGESYGGIAFMQTDSSHVSASDMQKTLIDTAAQFLALLISGESQD